MLRHPCPWDVGVRKIHHWTSEEITDSSALLEAQSAIAERTKPVFEIAVNAPCVEDVTEIPPQAFRRRRERHLDELVREDVRNDCRISIARDGLVAMVEIVAVIGKAQRQPLQHTCRQ